MDFHQTKVPASIVAEAVSDRANGKLGLGEGVMDFVDEVEVGNRLPGLGRSRGSDPFDFIEAGFTTTTMQDEIALGTFEGCFLLVHGVWGLMVGFGHEKTHGLWGAWVGVDLLVRTSRTGF